MFIENKYFKWYNNIIHTAVKRVKPVGYIENHHIIPRSLGGSNSSQNLVNLTAKEHFVCHLLLTKITSGAAKSKMINAAWAMANLKNDNQTRQKVHSRTYSLLREQFSENHSAVLCGRKHTLETRQKISIANKGKTSSRKGIPRSDQIKDKISKSLKGKAKTEDHKKKLSELWTGKNNPNFGKTWSADVRKKISLARANTPKKECPHCGKVMDPGNFKKSHGEKCKSFNIRG